MVNEPRSLTPGIRIQVLAIVVLAVVTHGVPGMRALKAVPIAVVILEARREYRIAAVYSS